MDIAFFHDCAVDGCYKKSIKGKQMCRQHQAEYDSGKKLKAFYGKTVQKNLNCKYLELLDFEYLDCEYLVGVSICDLNDAQKSDCCPLRGTEYEHNQTFHSDRATDRRDA